MQPSDVLDCQGELLERIRENPRFFMFLCIGAHTMTNFGTTNKWIDSNPSAGDLDGALDRALKTGEAANMEKVFPRGLAWTNALMNYLRAAYAYRVTSEMGLLLEHAAMSLDEDDVCDIELAPTGCGIVRFDRPIQVTDIRGMNMLVHWAVWGPSTYNDVPSLAITFFNDTWSQADENTLDFFEQAKGTMFEDVQHDIGRWMTVHFSAYATGHKVGPSMVKPSLEQQAQFLANGEKGEPLEGSNLFRYVHALFLLLNQTIVTVEDGLPNRPARKRALKRGIPGKVSVIALRRHESANRQEGESTVEWSHRWVVRGHWRWQACGPGRTERRRIWIAPFVKGPEDKDLIVTDKVYDLRR